MGLDHNRAHHNLHIIIIIIIIIYLLYVKVLIFLDNIMY